MAWKALRTRVIHAQYATPQTRNGSARHYRDHPLTVRASSSLTASQSGSMYLALSGASALGAASLYIVSQQEVEERRRLEAAFDVRLATERIKARDESAEISRRLQDAPVLWRGVLTQHDARLSGHLMLRGSRTGAAVDVLEEAQGSDERYLTVRDRQTGALGLHLAHWVKREDHALSHERTSPDATHQTAQQSPPAGV